MSNEIQKALTENDRRILYLLSEGSKSIFLLTLCAAAMMYASSYAMLTVSQIQQPADCVATEE